MLKHARVWEALVLSCAMLFCIVDSVSEDWLLEVGLLSQKIKACFQNQEKSVTILRF